MLRMRPLLIFFATFVLGTGGLLAFFHQLGLFEVNSIPIEISGALATSGDKLVEGPSGLQARLGSAVKKFQHKRIWDIDLLQVRSSIAKDEWVKDVWVSRSFPNGIHVHVQPKIAIAAILSGENSLLPMTEEANMLHALPFAAMPDVPVLRGDIFVKDLNRRKKTADFISDLPNQGPLARANISEIAWNSTNGYVITLIQPKVEILLGEDKLGTKVQRVAQVLNYMTGHQLRGHVIDASFAKKVLVKLRKGS
jgi:cell division septal protein FtsQ